MHHTPIPARFSGPSRWLLLLCLVGALAGLACGSGPDTGQPTTGTEPEDTTGVEEPAPEDSPGAVDMHECSSASDCVAVGCSCSCSGCGGFSSDDVINRASEQQWYEEQQCEPAHVCPEVCCPPRTIQCEAGRCVATGNSEASSE